ncbi:protein of unknown function [Legionella fallonii LLAP-10]|uniref:Uncharacterized protein n=1 Tax=Legionella fallonii LLAP-10 TaxID=1212491 RepID=A0A098G4K7_9GAMM|nr:protein of unknown function [Legionella fallonii LLAP-10]
MLSENQIDILFIRNFPYLLRSYFYTANSHQLISLELTRKNRILTFI